ncbi:MAG: hypothetical protein WCK51_06840 [Armatimonadota bacterium]
MSTITRVMFALLCVVLLACGGGGPKTDDNLGGVGPFSSLRMEVRLESTNAIIDPTNIFVGERVKFRITAIDGGVVGNPRITLNVNNWSLSGAPGGTLAPDGTYTGSGTASSSTGIATATADGLTFTTGVRVVQPQAVITGRIRLTTGQGASKLQIQAIDAAANVVATGLSGADGYIRMSLPTTAKKFSVDFSIADPTLIYYIRQFAYNGKDYSPGISGCVAPLPTLTNLVTSPLITDIAIYQASPTFPPPPPNGCS